MKVREKIFLCTELLFSIKLLLRRTLLLQCKFERFNI